MQAYTIQLSAEELTAHGKSRKQKYFSAPYQQSLICPGSVLGVEGVNALP
jgi:hypothetical protein